MDLIHQALRHNMAGAEELPAQLQHQQSSDSPSASQNIFPPGNGGFTDQVVMDLITNPQSVGPISNSQVDSSSRSHGQITGGGMWSKIKNNNEPWDPWGDGLRVSASTTHPLITVPPPTLSLPIWYPSTHFPIETHGPSFTASQNLRSTKDPRGYLESSEVGSESSVMSIRSRELRELMDKKKYEKDRLRKAKEREEKLRREEENMDKKRLYELRSDVLKLEEKRKQQEWLTYQRHQRLIRRKEEMSKIERRKRSRSSRRRRSRIRSSYPQNQGRRSRSRTRASPRKEAEPRGRKSRKRSRSVSKVSFRRESFTSNISPRRTPVQVQRDRSSINQALMKIAGRESSQSERYVRKADTPSIEASRGSSKARRRPTQERKVSRSPTRSRDSRRGSSRGRNRSRPRRMSRSRMRSRTPKSRFR